MGVMRKISGTVRNCQAFTILEFSIAIAILAIGILAAATMQYSTVTNNTSGNVFTQANMLAQQQMEILKNMDVDTMASGNDGGPIDEFGNLGTGGIYNRSWAVTLMPAFDPDTTSRRIVVTVNWDRPPHGARSVVVESVTRGNGI